ncbi:hypothetical protein UVI_02028670 [Ustilaginoidea virens]|uniref:Cx9C motif-containing protein 4, mitochondrial n=1 Tax=Ustilaginoidea virens TaxID=1159556 RepID=A0A1B5KUY1_USTVR|nr:hypothetical protein UVI_02028670 [Ustilaginoidea virens]
MLPRTRLAILARHADHVVNRQCAIQDCLTRSNYDDAKCQHVIKALYQCCEAFYQERGDDAASPSCPKPSLVRMKMKQMNEATFPSSRGCARMS